MENMIPQNTIEDYYPSEKARLVLGYLLETHCRYASEVFILESRDLVEHREHFYQGKAHTSKVNGKSLNQILQEHRQMAYAQELGITTSLNYSFGPNGTVGRNEINSSAQPLDLSRNCSPNETEDEIDVLLLTSDSSESESDPCLEIRESTSGDVRAMKDSNLISEDSIQTSGRDTTRTNPLVHSNLLRKESTGSSVRDSFKRSTRIESLRSFSKRTFINRRRASQEKVEVSHKMVQTDPMLTSSTCVQNEDVLLDSYMSPNAFSDQKLQDSEKEINSRISDLSIINVASCGFHFWNSLNKRKSKPNQRFPASLILNRIADYEREKEQGMLPADLIIYEEILRFHPLVQKITDCINSALTKEEIVDLSTTASSSSVIAQNDSQTESFISSALEKCADDPALLQLLSFLCRGAKLSQCKYFYYRCKTRDSPLKRADTDLETDSNEPNARISTSDSLVKIKNNTDSKHGIENIEDPGNQLQLASSQDQECETECNPKEKEDATVKAIPIGTPFVTTMDSVLQTPVTMSVSDMTVTSIENGEDGNVITTLTKTDNLTILPTIQSSAGFYQSLSTVAPFSTMPIFVPNTANTFQNNFQYRFVVNNPWTTPASQDIYFPLQSVSTENIAPQPLILNLNGGGSGMATAIINSVNMTTNGSGFKTGTAIINSGSVTTNGSDFGTGTAIMESGNGTTNGTDFESGTVTMDGENVTTNAIFSDDVQTKTQKKKVMQPKRSKKLKGASSNSKTTSTAKSKSTKAVSKMNCQSIAPKKDTYNQLIEYNSINRVVAADTNKHVAEQTSSLKSLISSAKLLTQSPGRPNSVFDQQLECVEKAFNDEDEDDPSFPDMLNSKLNNDSECRRSSSRLRHKNAIKACYQMNTKQSDIPAESVKNTAATSTECFIEQETQQKSEPTSMADVVLCAMQAALGKNFSGLENEESNISNSSKPSTIHAVLEKELMNDFDSGTQKTIVEQENHLLAMETAPGSTNSQNPLLECKSLKVSSSKGVDHSNQFIPNSQENKACLRTKNSLKTSIPCRKLNKRNIASKSKITKNWNFYFDSHENDFTIDLTQPIDVSGPLRDDMCVEVNKNTIQPKKKVVSKSISAKGSKKRKPKPVVQRSLSFQSSEKSISGFQSFPIKSSSLFSETHKTDEWYKYETTKNKPIKASKGNTLSKTKNLKTHKASVKDSVTQSKSLDNKGLTASDNSETHESQIEVSGLGKQSELYNSSLHEMAIEKKALDSTVGGNRKTAKGKKSNYVPVDDFVNETDSEENYPLIFLKGLFEARKKAGQNRQTKLSTDLIDPESIEDKALNLIVDDKLKVSKKKLYNAKATEFQTKISECKKLPKPCTSLVCEAAVGNKETLNSIVDSNCLTSKERLNCVTIDTFINTTEKDENSSAKVPLEISPRISPVSNYFKNNKSVSKEKQIQISTKKASNTNLNVLNNKAHSEGLNGDNLSSMNIILMDENLEKDETEALNSDAVDSIAKNSSEVLTKTLSVVIERLSPKTLDDVMYPAEVEHVNELNSATQPEFIKQNFANTSQSEKDVSTNHISTVAPSKERVRSVSDTPSRTRAAPYPKNKWKSENNNAVHKQSVPELGKMAFQKQNFPIQSDTSGSTRCLESLLPEKNLLIDASHSNVIIDSEQTSFSGSKLQKRSEKKASTKRSEKKAFTKRTNKERPKKKLCDSVTANLPQDNLTPQHQKDLCSISPDKTTLKGQELNQKYIISGEQPSKRKREVSPVDSFINSRTSLSSKRSDNSNKGSKVKNTGNGNNFHTPSQTLYSSRFAAKYRGVSPLPKKLKVSRSSYSCFESQSTMPVAIDAIASKDTETVSTPSASTNYSNAQHDPPRQSPLVSRKSTPKYLYSRSCAKYSKYMPAGVRLPLKFMHRSEISPSWIRYSKVERNTEQPKRVLFSPKGLQNKNNKPGKQSKTSKTRSELLKNKNAKSSHSDTGKHSLTPGSQEIDMEIRFSNTNERKRGIDESTLMSSKSKSPILSDSSHVKNKYFEKESLSSNLSIENDKLFRATNEISTDTFEHLINLQESADSIENHNRGVKDTKATSSELSGVSIQVHCSSKHVKESDKLNVIIPITSEHASEEIDMLDAALDGNKTNTALDFAKVPCTDKTNKRVCIKSASSNDDPIIARNDFAHNFTEIVKLKSDTSVEKGKSDEPASVSEVVEIGYNSEVVEIGYKDRKSQSTKPFCSSIANKLHATGTKESDYVGSDNKSSTSRERYPTCDSKKLIPIIDLDCENSDSFDETKEPHTEGSLQFVPKKETINSLPPNFPNVEKSPPCLNIELPKPDLIPFEDANSDSVIKLSPEEEIELKMAIESIDTGDSPSNFKSPSNSVNLGTSFETAEPPASLGDTHQDGLSDRKASGSGAKKMNFEILKKKIKEFGVDNILALLIERT